MTDDTRDNHEPPDQSDDEIIRELMALAAVHALDADDQAHVEVLIADRPDLQAEYRDLCEAAATMAAATAEEPPAALRASVLAAVAADAAAGVPPRVVDVDDPFDDSGDDSGRPGAPGDPGDASGRLGAPAPVVPMPSRSRGGWLYPLLAAAAAIVLVIGAAAIVRRDQGGDDPGDRLAAVLEDPDNVVMPFAGELSGLSMIYSPDAGAAVLSGSGVEPPEGTDVYELWHFDGERPVRVETFVPDGTGVVTVYLPGMDIAADARFAITIEPEGGTDAPTGPVVGDTAEV